MNSLTPDHAGECFNFPRGDARSYTFALDIMDKLLKYHKIMIARQKA